LCPLPAGEPQHILVVYSPGKTACFCNGQQVFSSDKIRGDFSNWNPQHLLFGDEWDGGRDWSGSLEGVAIYSRAIGAEEVRRRYASVKQRLENRPRPEQVVLEATLAETSPTPPPNLISPYRRVLVANTYEVKSVVKGRCESKKILVAEWGILDRKVVPLARQKGKTYKLALEKFDDHAELEPEKLILETDDLALPMYYEVRQ